MTLRILAQEENNILCNLQKDGYDYCTQVIRASILATYMKKHIGLFQEFTRKFPDIRGRDANDHFDDNRPFDKRNTRDRTLLAQMIVHTADLYGQATPWEVATAWGAAVVEEFKMEAEKHRKLGLLAPAYMANINSDKDVYALQAFFIGGIAIPLWTAMNGALTGLDEQLTNLLENYRKYQEGI